MEAKPGHEITLLQGVYGKLIWTTFLGACFCEALTLHFGLHHHWLMICAMLVPISFGPGFAVILTCWALAHDVNKDAVSAAADTH